MLAITTKYLRPTATKGARIKALSSNGQSITLDFHSIDANTETERYKAAAVALCKKMDWNAYPMVAGSTEDGFVFVFLPNAFKVAGEEKLRALKATKDSGGYIGIAGEDMINDLSYYLKG